MKNLILIVLLSFVALSCSKDNTSPQENDKRIKNDIPTELLGKWKQVAQRETNMETGGFSSWQTISSVSEYDWDFKEYSICCSSETELDCDTYFVSASNRKIIITGCNGHIYKYISYFQLLKVKGNELILSGAGIDTIIETKYVKVE